MKKYLFVVEPSDVNKVIFIGTQMECSRFIQKARYEHGQKLLMKLRTPNSYPIQFICRPFLWEQEL